MIFNIKRKHFIIIVLFLIFSIISLIIFESQNLSNNEFQGNTPNNVEIIKNNNSKDFSDLIYINSSEGWKLSYLDCAMFNQTAKLYKTNDAGKTWNEINNTEKSVPLETKTGITFINNNIGWITTSSPKGGYIGIYRTLDGGLTWKKHNLIVPEENNDYILNTYPPVFFSKLDGILLNEGESGNLVYVTHDGGQNWVVAEENTTTNNINWTFNNNISTWIITYNDVSWESKDGYTWTLK